MALFLTTDEINLYLKLLIQEAKEQLVLVSPYLKLNDRIRELLQDKNGQIAEVRIVYGKQELHKNERQWLAGQKHIKVSFCKNLHAKCYLSEHCCIVTSMNLYDFSQINNNETGIAVYKTDKALYGDALKEVRRLIRISEEVKTAPEPAAQQMQSDKEYKKLTTYRLGQIGKKTEKEMYQLLVKRGYLKIVNGGYELTEQGIKIGGEKRTGHDGRSRYSYFLWNNPALKPKK